MPFSQISKMGNSSKLFSKILNSIQISLIMVDIEGVIVSANHYTEELFGYEQSELIGNPVKILIPEEYKHNHDRQFIDYIKLPKSRPLGQGKRIYGLRIDGSKVPVEISLTPIRIEKGLFILASIIDVTEGVIVKDKLIVEEKEKKDLELVNNQLSDFAHTVSHDLTEPFLKLEKLIPKIVDNIQNPEKEVVKNIETVNQAISRGKQIVSDLLTFAQSSIANFKETNTEEIVKNVIVNYNDEQIKFIVDKLPDITGDPILIKQLFSNLISNAVKFQKNDSNEKLIEISCQENVFCVKDNGIGIEEKYLNDIFKPFFRVQNKEKFTGTGLGMSICKRIVDKHHGEIWIESKFNEGTKVYFTLSNRS